MKYIQSTITLVVLHTDDTPIDQMSIVEVGDEICSGGSSGAVINYESKELTKNEMADALTAQGSDPSFLIPEEEDA